MDERVGQSSLLSGTSECDCGQMFNRNSPSKWVHHAYMALSRIVDVRIDTSLEDVLSQGKFGFRIMTG